MIEELSGGASEMLKAHHIQWERAGQAEAQQSSAARHSSDKRGAWLQRQESELMRTQDKKTHRTFCSTSPCP